MTMKTELTQADREGNKLAELMIQACLSDHDYTTKTQAKNYPGPMKNGFRIAWQLAKDEISALTLQLAEKDAELESLKKENEELKAQPFVKTKMESD